jgi:hypothetical protein
MNARWWLATQVALASCCVCACSSKSAHDGAAASGTQTGTTTGGSHAAASGSGGTSGATTTGNASGSGGGASTQPPTPGGIAGKSAGGAGKSGGGSGGANGAGNGERDAGHGAGGADGAVAPPSGDTGTLPAISDPAQPGHFTPTETDNVGPNGDYTTIEPKELGEGGVKHPILIWGPGAGASPGIYQALLNHIASHGFVIVSYNSTPQGPELLTAIDWIVAESMRNGSPYFGKLDTSKIAAGGQSAGSLAVFAVANDPRWTTTLHINGGTFDPHTDVMNLRAPALFVCGDDPSKTGGDGTWQSDMARPNCDIDFMNATTPVWYGDVIGSSHTTVIDNPLNDPSTPADPLKVHYLAASAAWLRWQLAGDQVMKAMFIGPNCGFCMQTSVWEVQQKNLQ